MQLEIVYLWMMMRILQRRRSGLSFSLNFQNASTGVHSRRQIQHAPSPTHVADLRLKWVLGCCLELAIFRLEAENLLLMSTETYQRTQIIIPCP
ncbi:hypothetical protein AVEN_12650-1 [Araneus ventricosus]|uniref:Uncharacterized protein n=1 Tax=Araneus ventricosus TaxID=182803 RepID=A0A4Y2ABL2_ARAVE|nr:hypothetical protein AVEN_12650-1 [Araneus ventricosus]